MSATTADGFTKVDAPDGTPIFVPGEHDLSEDDVDRLAGSLDRGRPDDGEREDSDEEERHDDLRGDGAVPAASAGTNSGHVVADCR